MFKFEIIESSQYKFTKLIMEKMDFFQKLNISLENRANTILIIAKTQNRKILGGARLLKKNLENIQEDVRELVTALTSHKGYVWECSRVYLELSSVHRIPNRSEKKLILENFYQGLYEELVAFGAREKVSFVITRFLPEVYLSTKEFGLWPYVVELRPQNSPDGLFHGILPLTGSQYDAYCKTRKTTENHF